MFVLQKTFQTNCACRKDKLSYCLLGQIVLERDEIDLVPTNDLSEKQDVNCSCSLTLTVFLRPVISVSAKSCFLFISMNLPVLCIFQVSSLILENLRLQNR